VTPAPAGSVAAPGRIGVWLEAMRPRTLPAAVAPVLIGTALALRDGEAHLGAALAALGGAAAIQVGTNFANDYSDFARGTDHAPTLGRRRLLPGGLVTARAMGRATLAAFAVAVVIGLYLVLRGGWPVVAIGVASILAGLLYTGGPAPYGYRGLGDLFVLVFFGPVAVAGTYYVQALSLSGAAILAGLAPGLMAMAILAVNNLRDADSDAASGKRTLAVMLGTRFARAEHNAAILLACLAVPGLMLALGMAGPGVMVAALALVPAWPVMATIRRETDPRALNAALGATGRVMVVHALFFAGALALV
jgi:1,4-dihydroxy-2-naphthoate octaprenyltransferase